MLTELMNPHFYFNALNNLYGLVIADPEKAADAILSFSNVMEYVIYDSKKQKLPLEKELKFISSYVELEKLRYDNSNRIQLQLQGSGHEKFISPFLLIRLVENAFTHGMGTGHHDDYLQINISIEAGRLVYRSVYRVNENSARATGVSLANMRKHLCILYPSHRLVIDDSSSEFKVELQLEL